MSWEMKRIKSSGNRAGLFVTSFFGGVKTGRCLQVTQDVDVKGDGNLETQFIHLTEQQADELVKRIKDWKSGKASEHNPHGKSILFIDDFNQVKQ